MKRIPNLANPQFGRSSIGPAAILLATMFVLCARVAMMADDPEPLSPPDASPSPAPSAEAPTDARATPHGSDIAGHAIAATVNGEEISMSLVNDAVASVLQGRPIDKQALARLQAEVLAHLIDRTLIMQQLVRLGSALPTSDVTKGMEQLKQQLAKQNKDLNDLLKQRNITREQLHDELAWQMNWRRYLQQNLTERALEAHFEKNKTAFDGTQLRVSHILLRSDGASSPAESERLLGLLTKLRKRITTGKISFEDAARRYSQAPSRLRDGDMGFIPRNGLVVEPFAAAAFSLPEGDISQPVITPYGAHLLKVTDSRSGSKKWTDVKEALKTPATQAMFADLAAKQRATAKIEFSGACPYFEPGTKNLVVNSAGK